MIYCVNKNTSFMYIHGTDNDFYSMGSNIDFNKIIGILNINIDRNTEPIITEYIQNQINNKINFVKNYLARNE